MPEYTDLNVFGRPLEPAFNMDFKKMPSVMFQFSEYIPKWNLAFQHSFLAIHPSSEHVK